MLRSLRLTRPLAAKHLRACSLSSKPKKAAPSLGVVRLDYDYPPALGDIDHPGSGEIDFRPLDSWEGICDGYSVP